MLLVNDDEMLEHGPDEHAAVVYLAFMCHRLMEVSKEERAAHRLQRLWRRVRSRQTGTILNIAFSSRQRAGGRWD